jgi:biotin carboxylase
MIKVLLVDTNFSSLPIYESLISKGFQVHVVGANKNDCLAKISPYYWSFDYSDIDQLNELISKNDYKYIIPGCTDKSYSSCAAVSKGIFPGIESTINDRNINNKFYFREIANYLSIPIPKIISLEDKKINFPIIVKPVDSFSGKGITVINDFDDKEILKAVEYAKSKSPKAEYLIEEFVEGELYSHSSFIKNGKIATDFFVSEYSNINLFVVDTSRVDFLFDDNIKIKIRYHIEKFAAHLKLVDGLIHTQFIMKDGNFWLIEMTRRCPGDQYSQLIELTYGPCYVENYLAPYIGENITNLHNTAVNKFIIRHTITTNSEQTFGHISFNKQFKIEKFISLALVGDQLKKSPLSRVGILFVDAGDFESSNNIINDFNNKNNYLLL